jgi:hypothetical protein
MGIAMLWHRARPIKPIREHAILILNRIWERLAVGRSKWNPIQIPAYGVWWLKGILQCESCLTPWTAGLTAIAFGLQWGEVASCSTAAYAVHTLLHPVKEPS